MKHKLGLVWPVILLLVLPLAAAWFAYPETHLPPGFGEFPPQFVEQPPGFNLNIFVLVLLAELVVACIYLFPQWFGFKPVTHAERADTRTIPLPGWFWVGLVLTLFFWWLMWTRETMFGNLVYYAFSPLWWGFILVLDGITYRRSGGYSLLASRPKTFFISAVVSLVGWCFFEYTDYFALGNWYYPQTDLPGLSHASVVAIFLIAYTTVWPAIFEWYTLLNTFPKLVGRYANGPKLALPGKTLTWIGLALIVAMVFWPYHFFWAQWIGAMAVFAGVLIRAGIASPFSAMAAGNWSPVALIALASLINGLFWEIWNWGSVHLDPTLPATNPNYWVYDTPYVNVIHLFVEMPLLGFAGYLPFGIMVWVMFIWAGKVFGFNTHLLKAE
ncbi:MAG: mechanosensitive ion channel protein MscS [Gammaproteobacteria bacterium]|nr:mechanosensitive ion channel protein MscS [Gammaproteobacteria bacterium]